MAAQFRLVSTSGRISRDLRQFLLAKDVLGHAAEELSKEFTKGELLKDAPFDYLFAEATINYADGDGNLRRSSAQSSSSWRLNKRKREFVAPFDLNLSKWEKSARQPPADLENQLIREILRWTCRVVGAVALEFGDSPDKVRSFLGAFGVPLESVSAPATGASSNEDADSEKVIELSVETTDSAAEDALVLRRTLRERIEARLLSLGIGTFDGASSGAGSIELAFRVTDLERASDEIEAVARKIVGSRKYAVEIL